MTELTKEQLIEEAKLKIAIAKCHTNSGMARVEGELFKIALASLEAEPIAWKCGENIILFNPDTVEAYAKRAEISPKPLFSAPPTVVVPDDGREKFEALVRFHAGDKNHETLLIRANEGMNYQDPNVDLAWIFWKSSREHI